MTGNFIDTANRYTDGQSEKIVGDLIGSKRERFVVATKYTLNVRENDPNGGGNHRKSMRHAIEASLLRLRTDYVDLYWAHAWDYWTRWTRSCEAWTIWSKPGRSSM